MRKYIILSAVILIAVYSIACSKPEATAVTTETAASETQNVN